MQYYKVSFSSDDMGYPELVFIDLALDRWENRRISFFPDGKVICSSVDDKPEDEGYVWLGEAPWQPFEEMNFSEPNGFTVSSIEISAEAFERLWQRFHTGEKQKISLEEYERLRNEYPEG